MSTPIFPWFSFAGGFGGEYGYIDNFNYQHRQYEFFLKK
jgi:hypothetical protein